MKLKFHKIAEQFPLMSEIEFEALTNDILTNGLSEPIVLYEGKILDGRNRYLACERLGINLKKRDFVEFKGSHKQAIDFGVTANMARRHLSKSQIAMFIAINGLASKPDSSKRVTEEGKESIRIVAKRFGVTHMMVYKAFGVLDKNRRLAKKVLEGELSVTKAETHLKSVEAKPSIARTSQAKKKIKDLENALPNLETLSQQKRAKVLKHIKDAIRLLNSKS